MRLFRLLPALAIALSSQLAAAEATPAPADAAKAKAYPLATCIVSSEKLGEMGDPVSLVQDGQEVKFCCKGCVKAFKKDPAKYLKKLEAPAADQPAAGAAGK